MKHKCLDHSNAKKILLPTISIIAILSVICVSSSMSPNQAFASHSFELGVSGSSIPDNTHIALGGITLAKGEILPLYDASPNFVAGHFLAKVPCDSKKVPKVTVIAGHIDEHADMTHVDKVPLYYISHASDRLSCTYHAHIPDPLNGGSPRVTDIDFVNLSSSPIEFNGGDAVDINVQRSLGSIVSQSYEGDTKLPSTIKHGNPVFDLNDNNPNNDGLGAAD